MLHRSISIKLRQRARRHPLAMAAAMLGTPMLLTACLGGGGDAPAAEPTPEAPSATVSQLVKVIDGAIQGATVCLDLNTNGLCDNGEPNATTTADGTATLTLARTDAGKYPVLALVGTNAVDADHGPVTVAYTLMAPADQPGVISPLSSLVVAQSANTGVDTTAAAAAVREALGLAASPLADFTLATTPGAAATQAAARLLVVATQLQHTATTDAKAADGSALPAADVARAIQGHLLSLLPEVAAAVANPAVAQASTSAERQAAVTSAATALVGAHGLSSSGLAAAVASASAPLAPDTLGETPSASLSLRWFSYTDAGNYYFRLYKASAEQSTTVNGMKRFTEYRQQARATAGVNSFYQQWGEGLNNWARNSMVWTGSAWYDCPTEAEHQVTPTDANGHLQSLYCSVYKTSTERRVRDIAGLKMADVVGEIRAYPLKDRSGEFAQWGPDPLVHASALAATFPAGAKLYYQTSVETANPEAYSTTGNDAAPIYTAAVSRGEATACNQVSGAATAFKQDGPLTLELMVSRYTGTPCVFSPRSTPTGNVANEWWGQSTFNVGDLATDYSDNSGSGYFRNGVQALRASFTGNGQGVSYWLCLRRASDSSPRNCTAAGTGTYTIEPLGDARVLRLAGLPAVAAQLGYTRTMVERQQVLWYGYRSKLGSDRQIRLNLEATNALMAALGIPAPQTGSPLTADSLLRDYTPQQGRVDAGGNGSFSRGALGWMPSIPGSLVGAWALVAGNPTSRSQTFFFFADGSYVMVDPRGDEGPSSCGGPGYEKGSYRLDAATQAFNGVGITLDTNGCAGLHDATNGANNGFGADRRLTLAADGQSLTVVSQEGTFTLQRLGR